MTLPVLRPYKAAVVRFVDQFFVELKHWAVSWFPGSLQPIVSILFSLVPILIFFPLLFAVMTLIERKGLGRIQNRFGPNRVGPAGLWQPAADGLKALTKEDIVPFLADHTVHFLAPVVLVVPVLLSFAVLPYGRNMTPLSLDAGVLFFFAAGASTELAIFMAGWSSRNKYSLLGAMRAISQMISYEIPLVLSTLSVVLAAGSLSLDGIVQSQQGFHFGFLARWFVFTPWGLAGFIFFLIAALAESNRSPFDIPEAESEIIAGHLTEYSGFKYALFFLAEYLGMFALSGLGITLFLGGWTAPFSFLAWVPSYLWFQLKLLGLLFLFIWIRGTLPRLRSDQLLKFAWKFLLPLCLVNLFAAAFWQLTAVWQFGAAPLVRWASTAALILGAYWLLQGPFAKGGQFGPRVYRYGTS